MLVARGPATRSRCPTQISSRVLSEPAVGRISIDLQEQPDNLASLPFDDARGGCLAWLHRDDRGGPDQIRIVRQIFAGAIHLLVRGLKFKRLLVL